MQEPQSVPIESLRGRPVRWILRCLAIVNLLAVVLSLLLIHVVSEKWWPAVVLTYAPRAFLLIPGVVLFLISFTTGLRTQLINLISVALVAGPGMELNIPWAAAHPHADAFRLRVVTCNTAAFSGGTDAILREIVACEPELVLLQEILPPHVPSLAEAFPDWSVVVRGEFAVISRYPLTLDDVCNTSGINRISAIAVNVESPQGPVCAVNIHVMTARDGIRLLEPEPWLSSGAITGLGKHQALRVSEIDEVRGFVREVANGRPIVIGGDFNMPVSSSLYRSRWRDFTNAFSATGWGYGYTAPCHTTGFLPADWPWIRVDHILVDSSLSVAACRTGQGHGSDHRLLIAELATRGSGALSGGNR